MQQSKKATKRFGWPQFAVIAAVIVMSVAIVLFHDEIIKLGSWGYAGVFLIMFFGSLTVVLPAPTMPLLAAFAATTPHPLLLGVVSGVGSALGELSGYMLGWSGSGMFEKTKLYKKIERAVERWEFLTITLLAFIPNPLFDIAGIAAGTLRVPWYRFLLATLVGKILRNTLIVYAVLYSVDWFKNWW